MKQAQALEMMEQVLKGSALQDLPAMMRHMQAGMGMHTPMQVQCIVKFLITYI